MPSEDKEFEQFKKWKAQNNKENQEKENDEMIDTIVSEPLNGKQQIQVITSGSKNKQLFIHLIANKNQEIDVLKKKTYDQDFDWNKRTFIIKHEMFITDKDGNNHYYQDINDTHGGLSFHKEHIDNCNSCNKKLSKDSQISYNLTRKRNLSGIWGVDNQHMILLMILGIGLMVALVAVFYIIGDDNSTHKALEAYLPKQTATNTAHFILGGILNIAR